MTGTPFTGWQTSANGTTLASGATIDFWVPGTSTRRTPFTDSALTTPTANPVLLNSSGWTTTRVYLDPELAYEYEVKSSDGGTTYVPRTLIPAGVGGAQPLSDLLSSIANGAPVAGELPFATAGDAVEWRPIAASDLPDANDEIRLSDYAATQAGFVSAAEAAIAAGKWLNGEEIDITLTSLMTITLTGPLRWRNVRLQKLSQSAADYEYAVTVNGPDFANVTTLSANAAIGATSLTVSSASNIVAGAKYLLISDTIYNPDPGAYGNVTANKSEWVRVRDTYAGGTTVALSQTLQTSYTTAANAKLYRFLETATVEWDNVVITGGGIGDAQGAVRFNRCTIERMTNCGSQDNEYAGFTFNLCGFNSYVSAWIENSDLTGFGYGIETVGCDAPLIDWVWGENVRHVVTRGSSFQATLPFSGGNVYILGRGGVTSSVTGIRSVGSVDDTHTGHVGHIIGTVTGDLVGGNSQEAITVESHGISYDAVRVTGADLPVTVLYYGHPTDEPPPVIKFGSVDTGYGGTGSNQVLLAINRDASTRNTVHVHADVVEGRYPGGVNATATEGSVYLTIDKAVLLTRTTHTVSAISTANGQAFITIEHPWLSDGSGSGSIYTINADGDAWNTANAGQLGAIVTLGPGLIAGGTTVLRANDAQIVLNGVRGSTTSSLTGIGTVLVPNSVSSTVVPLASPVSLTTATAATIASVSLSPGVWSVSGKLAFSPAGTTSITRLIGAINTTNNALPSVLDVSTSQNQVGNAAYVPGTITINLVTGEAILTLTATTTVYLIAHATFTVSTLTAYGTIQATRLS